MQFHDKVTDDVLPDAPIPRGKEVDVRMMVDSDQEIVKVASRLHDLL